MSLRLHVAAPLAEGAEIDLPPEAARHAQVRRVQPGDLLHLFDGRGHEHGAQVLAMTRQGVRVRVGTACPVLPEPGVRVTLAVGMPTNERMDALVEKAVELGAFALQPLQCARSVLRLEGERAQRRQAHWQSVAASASEQCGRAFLPDVGPVRSLGEWLPGPPGRRLVLSLAPDAQPLPQAWSARGAPQHVARVDANATACTLLSGPEGGLAPEEEAAARAAGFVPVSLGPRVLRADTAPLAALAWLVLQPGD